MAQARVEAGASSTAAARSAWTDVVADLRARLEAAETVASSGPLGGRRTKTEKARAESERLLRDAESAAQGLRAELSSAHADVATARAEAATARATVEVERRRLDETSARVKSDAAGGGAPRV